MGLFGGKLQGYVEGHGTFTYGDSGKTGKYEYIDIGGKELKGIRATAYLADRINAGETMTVSYVRFLTLFGLLPTVVAVRGANGRVYRWKGLIRTIFDFAITLLFASVAVGAILSEETTSVFSLQAAILFWFALPFLDMLTIIFRSRTT